MTLVDTSVWIDYFRKNETPQIQWLNDALNENEDLCTCGLICAEILQGIKNETQYRKVKHLLGSLLYLPMKRQTYFDAANIFRTAKTKGKTIRNTIDCLIAACVMDNKATLLQRDRDFEVIAEIVNLRLVKP